jgi:hypothetical protein
VEHINKVAVEVAVAALVEIHPLLAAVQLVTAVWLCLVLSQDQVFCMLVAVAVVVMLVAPHVAAMAAEQLLHQEEAATVQIKIPTAPQVVLILVVVEAAEVMDQHQDKPEVLVLLLFVIQIVIQQQQALRVLQLSQLQVGIESTHGLVLAL